MSPGGPTGGHTARRCVAVVAPGRSGTSVTAAILQRAGLRLGGELVGSSPNNPHGSFEDVEIVARHFRLTSSIPFHPLLPRPADWASSPAYDEVRSELTEYVAGEVTRDPSTWGFKDPQTASFWPMWERIFADVDVEPMVVYCVRPSAQVVRSLMVAYGMSQEFAEGIVAYRSLSALGDIDRPIHFVHYDRWREEPAEQLDGLARFCGLAEPTDPAAMVAEVFDPRLDRQQAASLPAVSGVLLELDRVLAGCGGSAGDRVAVRGWCHDLERQPAPALPAL